MSVKVAVIGCGTWGKNLVRNFYNLGALHTICDLDKETLISMAEQYKGVGTTDNLDNVFNSSEIDAVIIATPSHTHYSLVSKALTSNKNVYVEKPIATNSLEALELTKLAEEKELVLMVGHLLLYHPAVNRLKAIVQEGQLGDIVYAQSDRQNINYFKNDRNVIWDLAPHDLSMISYVLGEKPISVTASVGTSTANDGIIDMAHFDMDFPHDVQAHISSSWIHPVKRVLLLIRGTKSTAVLNDVEFENKLQIYDNFSPAKVVEFPDYLEIEPLKLECQHFLNCIINKTKPRSDGLNGYEVVKILEEAERMMLGTELNKVSNFKLASSRKKIKPLNPPNEPLV